jgi:aryl-alcohol dehydrogenase-like predicted oxidoreductase
MVSRLGFGGYRVDDESPDYRVALEAALEGGINLLDTSSNYTEGGSERLIGGVLRLQPELRPQVVVVSKAGYLQGTNLDRARAREQLGHPYAELVTYQEGLWHCIHPDFLEDQLELCCMRLSLEKLDVFLLHNPEYFLLDAKQKGTELKVAQAEFERRIEQAFEKLESLAKAGRIGWYGISSNTFAAPDSEYTAVSFGRMLELARKVGGEDHHFAVVQTPLNLLEPEAAEGFSEHVQQAGLGLLINRPLNCFVQQTLVRLADFESEEEPNLERSLKLMGEIENEYRETFGPFVQGPGSEQLFRFAENMRGLDLHLQNLDHWTQLESRQIRPALLDQVQALDQAMTGAITEPWVKWREKYMTAFRDVSNDLEEVAIRKSQRVAESVAELMPNMPGAGAGASLSQLGVWVVDGVPGVTSVLVGMRKEEYVEDLLPVLGWNPCKNSLQVMEALKQWSNPHGVLA